MPRRRDDLHSSCLETSLKAQTKEKKTQEERTTGGGGIIDGAKALESVTGAGATPAQPEGPTGARRSIKCCSRVASKELW